ncbi:hypothetical protein [Chitinilyticum piscinae]|uniref:Uncharacterized protein n=1 Tax=Chitinilyticum piscinae TaxID=2866724 RepID=A0A8J7FJC9_9NEIS|nr:hypothetical protein [Chitinilyticum piscinae]MBE9607904.1 hypothetical protein [Chitinilyticum piscinae]
MRHAGLRPIAGFVLVLGVALSLPACWQLLRLALLRQQPEVTIAVTRTWITQEDSTQFYWYRNGRPKTEPLRRDWVELAELPDSPAVAPPPAPPTAGEDRASAAVAAVMAKIRATPLPIPAGTARYVRDDLPPALRASLYPGKIVAGRVGLGTAILSGESGNGLGGARGPLLALGAALVLLGGLMWRLFGGKPKGIS